MESRSFFGKQKLIYVLVFLSLIAGLSLRLLDLTDLPLDFHPTRQLHSALIARGMYYQFAVNVPDWQRQMALRQWQEEDVLEPQLFETIVAGTYLLLGEHLWIARLYSALFWILAGLALFALARRMTSLDGALLALFYFLFLEFGVLASRSFQPDPLMVALIAGSLWSFHHWKQQGIWKWALLTGVLSGLSIYVKPMAVFFLFGAYALTGLYRPNFKELLKNRQLWSILILSIMPVSLYLLDGIYLHKYLDVNSSLRIFPQLWLDPAFYVRWYNMIGNTVGTGAFLLSLLGIFILRCGSDRFMVLGLWFGYFLYGLVFAYFIGTHNYYQLPLVLIVSLSLSIVAKALFDPLVAANQNTFIPKLFVGGFILIGIIFSAWGARVTLLRENYRNEVEFWQNLGDLLGHTSKVVGLTHDYGHRLAYFGWQESDPWLLTGDIKIRELGNVELDLSQKLNDVLDSHQFFVVTQFNQLNSQPAVKDLLEENYPVYAQGDGYLIFDLRK